MFWNKREMEVGKMMRMLDTCKEKAPLACMCMAGAAVAAAITLKCMKKHHSSLMVGQLVAPMMMLGMYDKIARKAEHGKRHKRHHHKHDSCW